MQVQVGVESGGGEAELRSLHAWLRTSPEMRTTSTVSLMEAPPSLGAMGGGLDVIQLVTDNVWSAAAFVMAIVTWRQTRPKPPAVTIRRGGVEVTLDEGSDAQIRHAISVLEASNASDEAGE